MRLLSSNAAVYAACALLVAAFSGLLYSELTERIYAGQSEQAGTIVLKKKDVQRKYRSQVIWEDIEQSMPVYWGDSLKTMEFSDSLIKLSDGTEIAMEENSMIQLIWEEEQLSIDFIRGSMQVNRYGITPAKLKDLVIKSGKAKVISGKSNLTISGGGGQVKIDAGKGEAKVILEGKESSVKESQKAIITPAGGAVDVREQDIILISPGYGSYLMTHTAAEKVHFEWSKTGGNSAFEVSRNAQFSDILLSEKISKNFADRDLEEGEYYWRVTEEKAAGKKRSSNTWKFTVLRNRPAKIISPRDGARFVYEGNPPMIDFMWEPGEYASSYTLQIASDKGFTKMIKSVDTRNASISIEPQGEGTHYWRLIVWTPFEGRSELPAAPVYSFETVKTAADKREGLKLLKPQENEKIFRKDMGENAYVFSVAKDQNFDRYRFVISNETTFKKIIYEDENANNFTVVKKDLPEGRYYWKAEGKLRDSSRSVESKAGRFDVIAAAAVSILSPKNDAVIYNKPGKSNPPVAFSWTGGCPDCSYTLSLYTDREMKTEYKKITVPGNSAELGDIDDGKYYWSVTQTAKGGSAVSTGPRVLSIKYILVPPEAVTPAARAVINMKEKDSLVFEWRECPGANLYRVRLYKDNKKKDILLFEKDTADTKIVFDDLKLLDRGSFYWTIQSIEADRQKVRIIKKSELAKNVFKITLGKRLEKPKLEGIKIE